MKRVVSKDFVRPKNVVLVIIDNLRADCVGFIGGSTKTPTLDFLCENGIVYTKCVTCSNHTASSVSSIITSCYPFKHGLRFNGLKLQTTGINCLPEVLRKAGFKTAAAVSSSTLSLEKDFGHGFDIFSDYSPITNYRYLERLGLDSINVYKIIKFVTSKMTTSPFSRKGKEVNRDIDKILNSAIREGFFLMVHYSDIHEEPTGFLPQFSGTNDDKGDRKNENITRFKGKNVPLGDLAIKGLIKKLQEKDLLKDTLLVITSDHGESLYENELLNYSPSSPFALNRTYKGHGFSLYDSEINVPLIFYYKGLQSQKVNKMVRTIDIAPTILSLLDVDIPESMEGINILKEDFEDLVAYAEIPYINGDMKCIRTDHWKYIWNEKGLSKLYDLSQYPLEQKDVSESNSEIVKKMQEIVRSLHNNISNLSVVAEPSDEIKQELISLGYWKE